MLAPDPHTMHRLKMYVGANNHTVAKARYYYEFCKNPEVRGKLHKLICEALKTDDWRLLRIRMGGWW